MEAWWARTAAITGRASSAVATLACACSGEAAKAAQSRAALIFICGQVLRHLGVAKQSIDMAAFLEAFVEQEFEPGGIFGVHPSCDLALQIGGIGSERLQHRLCIGAEQGHDEGG